MKLIDALNKAAATRINPVYSLFGYTDKSWELYMRTDNPQEIIDEYTYRLHQVSIIEVRCDGMRVEFDSI